jgi:hypothetical protein
MAWASAKPNARGPKPFLVEVALESLKYGSIFAAVAIRRAYVLAKLRDVTVIGAAAGTQTKSAEVQETAGIAALNSTLGGR